MNAPEAWKVLPACTKLSDCWANDTLVLPKFCGTVPGVSWSRSKKLPRPSGIFSTSSRRDAAGHLGGGGVDELGAGGGDGDLLAGGADFELQIDVRRLSRFHGAVGDGGGLEALGGDGDGVGAGQQGLEGIDTFAVGYGLAQRARCSDCVSLTIAPAKAAPCWSVTLPVMEVVVST